MQFTVRDLMIEVLPAADADCHDLRLCQPDTAPPPKPKPKPTPKPRPDCQPITATGGADGYAIAGWELMPLAALRQQLREAIRA